MNFKQYRDAFRRRLECRVMRLGYNMTREERIEKLKNGSETAIWAAEEIERLQKAIKKTIEDNLHLADGDVCTLIELKRAINYDA